MSESSEPGDAVRAALVEAGEWAEQEATLPGPAQARQRSRARTNARVAGTAALTVLAVLGAVLGIGRLTGDDPAGLRPAGPPVPIAAVPTTIPEDVELGPDWSADPESSGGPVDRLPFDVCPGAGIPGVDSAVDQRFRWVTAHESGEGQGLLVFADADGAVAFMSGLRSAADRCSVALPRPQGGTSVIVRGPLAGGWGEGVALVQLSVPAVTGEQPIIGTYLLVVRVGSSVALQASAGEYYFTEIPSTPPAEVVERIRPPLDALAPKLCRWTAAGC